MRKLFYIFITSLIVGITFSCHSKSDDEQAHSVADSFATHFFNWQYKECLPFATAESRARLSFYASNVMQEDVDILRAKEADATIELIDGKSVNDTTRMVTVMIRDVLVADTIGKPARHEDACTITLKMVKRKKWLVDLTEEIRMAFPQQNEQPYPVQD